MKVSTSTAKIRTGLSVVETEPVPNAERLTTELRALSGMVTMPSIAEAKKDKRTWVATYGPGNAPGPVRELIQWTKEKLYDIKPVGLLVTVASSMRQGTISLPQPHPATIFRFLLTFGEKDVYLLDPDVPIVNTALKDTLEEYVSHRATRKAILGPSGLQERVITMGPGTLLTLGSSLMCDYLVRSPVPPTGKHRGAAPIRPAKYHRVCVVIDYYGTDEHMRTVSEKMRATVKVLGTGLNKVPEMMAEAEEALDKARAPEPDETVPVPPTPVSEEVDAEMDDLLDQL